MKLNEYEWSRNPRGMHSALNFLDISELRRAQMGWAKIVALADGEVALAEAAMDAGLTPIVRIYRERPGNAPVDQLAYQQFRSYINAGVRWFEFYNEPNLDIEWPRGADYNPNNPSVIGPLMDNWLTWAEFITDLGGYPGFPSLSDVNDGSWSDTITWVRRMTEYMFDTHYDRFRAVLNNGAYIAVHPYIYNHFHQEIPGGGPQSARPPGQQRADEGGWHFEYPYDPINQADDPGRSVWGGTAKAPFGDTVSLLGCSVAVLEQLQSLFDVEAVPFVGTEGGITPPSFGNTVQADNRYPPITQQSHAEATLAMYDWIATTAPPWFFGIALWKFDDYYLSDSGPLPVIGRFAQRPPIFKYVPDTPAFTDDLSNTTVTLPTVNLEPDHHFIFLTPGFTEEWFFNAAQNYWNTFKPTLLPDLSFIDRIPDDQNVAITAITMPDMVDWLAVNIVQRWSAVQLDTLVVQQADDLTQLLDQRVILGRRFG